MGRQVPFDNKWLSAKLTRGGLAGVCLAPRHPLPRPSVTCSACGLEVGSPADNPIFWVNQFWAAVQRALEARAFTCYDCMRAPMEHEWRPSVAVYAGAEVTIQLALYAIASRILLL